MAGLQGAGACAAQSKPGAKGTLCARLHSKLVTHHLLACTRSGCAPRCSRAGAAHALVAQANPYRHLERPVVTNRLKSPFNARCITPHALPPDTSSGTGEADSGGSSPGIGTATHTERAIQQFDHATSVYEVLGLLKDNTATSVTSPSPLQAAALRALARCFAPIASAASAAAADTSEVFMVLPALNALVPYAEANLYDQVLPEHTHRAVLAAGLHAGLGALCMTECPSSWHTAAHSAAEATNAVAALMEKCQGASALQSAGGVSSSANSGSSGSSSGSLPSLPPLAAQDSMRLAAALIAAGGCHTLPRPCAALLLHLLSAGGVLPLLPDWALQQALLHVLPGAGLPLPDALAVALEARMRTAGTTGGGAAAPATGAFATAVSRAAVLRRCGASAVHSQRALLQMVGDGSVKRLSPQQTVEALAELEACGIREQLAVAQRPRLLEREQRVDREGVDGPFAGCALQLLQRLCGLVNERKLDFREVAAALRHLAALRRRLEGLHCTNVNHLVVEIVQKTVWARSSAELAEMVARDTQGLWAFLEATQAIGAKSINDFAFQSVVRREMWVGESLRARVADPRFGASEHYAYAIMLDAACAIGPYYLMPATVLKLLPAVTPMMKNSTARELGLMYGALVLHGSYGRQGLEQELQLAIGQVEPLYKASLERLAARTDLPPLAHLDAMLDALEPVVLADPHNWYGNIRPRDLYARTLRVEDYLREPLQRFVTDPRVTSERVPRGVTPWDDRQLVRASVELSEELLLESLFSRGLDRDPEMNGAFMIGANELTERDLKDVDSAAGAGWFDPERFPLVPLPLELRPPPGQRHGMPGGDGRDAEREAYVRSIAPALMTARRLAQLSRITERGRELRNVLQIALAQHQHVGGRRWVTAMGFAVHPAWAEHHFVQRPYGLVRFADIPAGYDVWYDFWYDGTMLPDWASLARASLSSDGKDEMSSILATLKYNGVYCGPVEDKAPSKGSAEVPAATATLEARRKMWARKREEREEEAARVKEVQVKIGATGIMVRARDAGRAMLTVTSMIGDLASKLAP